MGSLFSLTPPIPITRTNYVCDKQFHLEPVRRLYAAEEAGTEHYALLIINARESSFWLANDLEIRKVPGGTISTSINKSHKKGGQSQARMGRLHENKRQHNHTYIAEQILQKFWDAERNRPREGVLGVIVGGAAETRTKVWECTELAPLRPWIVCNRPFSGTGSSASSSSSSSRSSSTGASATPEKIALQLWQESAEDRERWTREGEETLLTEIETLLATEPDRLDFGVTEVLQGLEHYIYERVYLAADCDQVLNLLQDHSECTFRQLSEGCIPEYGGCIGVKWI